MTSTSGSGDGYVVEDSPEGRSLVVTGPWSDLTADALRRGDADGLVLNYARGFSEGGLGFLDDWGVRRLKVLDRGIVDLDAIGRLGSSLEHLSVQAAPSAELDLAQLPRLRSVSGEWKLIRGTLGAVDALQTVITWRFDEPDLRAFRDHVHLRHLTVKEAPHLETLAGVGDLTELEELSVFLARRLHDIADVAGVAAPLRSFELEDCPSIDAIDDIEVLVNLSFLGLSECGPIQSFMPIGPLEQLEVLYAWGSTRVVDKGLSPLAGLPKLREIRMRDRPGYKPRVKDLVAALELRSHDLGRP